MPEPTSWEHGRMRFIATVLLLLILVGRPAYGQVPPLSRQQQYEDQKKSPALAITMEALCPIAGIGGFYAGDTDRATVLAILSGVAGGVGVGSVFWLLHIDDDSSGVGAVTSRVEQSTAISLLVTSAVVYLLTRASGLALASEATRSFNLDLQQRLGAGDPSLGYSSPPR
jgi:hypothetical protein